MGFKVTLHSALFAAPTQPSLSLVTFLHEGVWVQQEWYVDYDAQLRATIDFASGLRSVQLNVRHRSALTRDTHHYSFFLIIYLFDCFVWCTENAVQHQRGSPALHRLPAEGRHAAHGTRLPMN